MSNQDCRITADSDQSTIGILGSLSGGNPGAMSVLMRWIDREGPVAIVAMVTVLDMKHLYDHHIWLVFKEVCGEDIDRFIYHVSMELPNQLTGKLSVSGPYIGQVNLNEFQARRVFGAPGLYWALEKPPRDPHYTYPIV